MVAFIGSLVNANTVADGGVTDSGAPANSAWTFGVATYLLSITFGLYTIVNVIRLQSRRIRELAEDGPYAA